ncbi:MAG TPA: T9SS type A sorting domain-containing protein, partial [Chitinophagaceae bacterium]|nr:T9SS type A sorting domain-containing protein [Chitinophagaceae bacterium]
TSGSGPDYYAKPMGYVMNHVVFGDSLSNTADFLGSGTVDFDYTSSTYSIIFSSAKFALAANSADTITFRLKYYYCTGTLLKAGLTAFNAVKNKQGTVDLNWLTENEAAGRHYNLQKSIDGQHFETIYKTNAAPGTSATGYYKFNYRPGKNESGKIEFRLEQTEQDGAISYSPLRMVDLGNKSTGNASLYPNPSSGSSTLIFNNSQKGNWLVAVYSATGKLLQKMECRNAISASINSNGSFPKGLYMVRITNEITGEIQVRQLIIQ